MAGESKYLFPKSEDKNDKMIKEKCTVMKGKEGERGRWREGRGWILVYVFSWIESSVCRLGWGLTKFGSIRGSPDGIQHLTKSNFRTGKNLRKEKERGHTGALM